MKSALKFMSCPAQASARVVDGKLILSLPHAMTPVVWQMDFGEIKASALEVRKDADKGVFSLVLKTPNGGITDIAPFEKRDQAIAGLMAASRALENAHGKIRVQAGSAATEGQTISFVTPQQKSGSSKWGMALVVLFLLLLFGVWTMLSTHQPGMPAGTANPGGPGGAQESPTGVPLSADEFLMRN
jgi:hypothetical protein